MNYILRAEYENGWTETEVSKLKDDVAFTELCEAFQAHEGLVLFQVLDAKTRKVLFSHNVEEGEEVTV